MTGVELIAAERERQVTEEGYSPEHDQAHDNGALAYAAACYAAPEPIFRLSLQQNDPLYDVAGGQVVWHEPWPHGWRRTFESGPANQIPLDRRVRQLVKAGALIAAEIDRLQAAVS